MFRNYIAIGLFLSMVCAILLSGCASVPIYNMARTGNFGIINPLGLLIGIVLIYYSWIEAKKQNRNPWTWVILTFLFGLFPAVILILFLKKVPIPDDKNKALKDGPD
jgi:RsiW-degrading membrane proteinase PrsW (M82 family)